MAGTSTLPPELRSTVSPEPRDGVTGVPFVATFSDAWENQNDTKNRCAHHRMASAGTHARIARDESFHSKCDICALGGQPVHHSRISRKFQAFTTMHVGSSPRDLSDDFRDPGTRPVQHLLDIRPGK